MGAFSLEHLQRYDLRQRELPKMTRLSYSLATAVLLLRANPAVGFVPISARTVSARFTGCSPSVALKAATWGDTRTNVDYDRARECAESFGECSVEDMERMKNALHAERIANFLTAKNDPAWPEAELQDRILEEDLDLQLKNLQAYINDPRVESLEMPGQQRAEKVHSDLEMMDHAISVPTRADVYSASPEAEHTASPWLEHFAENAMSSSDVLMKNSEAFALLATLMIIMFLPEAIHHGMK